MARTVKVRNVRQVGGKVHLLFTNKEGLEFDSLAEMRQWSRTWDDNEKEALKKLLVFWWVKTTGGTDTALLDNRQITLDIEALVEKLVVI